MQLTSLFAATFKHYRDELGISQGEIAANAGLDRTYISQLERGIKSPTLTTLEKIAGCLNIDAQSLLRKPNEAKRPRFPSNYHVSDIRQIRVSRRNKPVRLDASIITRAVNIAHNLVDDFYASELDVASILGLRNLSAFIGELFAAAMVKAANKLLLSNPHQDGYPDLLLMDDYGIRKLRLVDGLTNSKAPFSPFAGGGIEVKATCGSVPTPAQCTKRGINRPDMGDSRIRVMTGYDWKAHHRETNNLVGILWDFIDRRPRIVAVFYSSDLSESDWGKIVQPKVDGGRTTSVSIMNRTGIEKMYRGWICVLNQSEYSGFLNKRNKSDLIPD